MDNRSKLGPLPKDVVDIIRAFSKPHPLFDLYPAAKKAFDVCFWKPIRDGLTGKDAVEVHKALKIYLKKRSRLILLKNSGVDRDTNAMLSFCLAQVDELDSYDTVMTKLMEYY